ncbi:MAG TPA: DNA translocase FtsK [Chitinophagales bacterium]|nr:DNA translocase FtsK [Chitinophagales bacterium]HMW12574.1 DNA translocase FtsK [Chitinophagales bacterium]HMX59838.1 DNA translocase FtsK [Chitinophagales bacterium]HMY22863.1 DNA translocase FtsK [Chitinophagales bacterium]HMZ33475.1 DNA translocase FtsK [Chitinophagales bacterium]
MAEEVVKEKVKRTKKAPINEAVEESEPAPLIETDTLKTGFGLFFLFLAITLAVAFGSYLFTWKDDQDKVLNFSWKIIFSKEALVENRMGRIGAYLAHVFFYVFFGVASFIIPYLLFCIGINLTFKERIFKLTKIFFSSLFWIVFIATLASFIFSNYDFPFGGGLGRNNYEWLSTLIGNLGLGILLGIIGFSFLGFNLKDIYEKFTRWKQTWKAQYEAENKNSSTAEIDDFYKEEALKKEDGYDMESIIPEEKEQAIPHHKDETFEILNEQEEVIQSNSKEIKMELIEKETEEIEFENTTIEPTSKKEKFSLEPDFEIEEIQAFGTIDENANAAWTHIQKENETDFEADKEHFGLDTNFDPKLELSKYKFPNVDLLEEHGSGQIEINKEELEQNKNQIVQTLSHYNIGIEKIKATVGPTVTLYEIVPDKGVRISKIKNLEDDIALSLSALGIRIIAPIPGRGTIGIEVPNEKKSIVSMRSLIAGEKFQKSDMDLPIALGKTISNEDFVVDLAKMPHLLMAGATGQGKSVGLNAILVSLLYKKHPAELKFVLVDPKKVELNLYKLIENHYLAKLPDEEEAIITDNKKVIYTLNALCIEMDTRYELLKAAQVRHIKEYNQKFLKRQLNPNNGHRFLPYIVLVVDEFADLMMTAGKEVEAPIARLAQLARAIGIHLVIATQRPSVNIITGTIKANFPGRIAFKVTAKVDSRTILDASGADQLIGRGDMLLSQSGELTRLQCPFVDTPEVEHIAKFIGTQKGFPTPYELPEYIDPKEADKNGERSFDFSQRDELFTEAARLIVRNQIGSTSLIQRKLALGYARSGRLMDQLEAASIVGPNLGSKAREVYVKTDEELERILQELGEQ